MAKSQTSSAEHAAKKLARLAAVQALYQNTFEQEPLRQIIRDCIDSHFAGLRDDENGKALTPDPDRELFGAIVEGVANHKEELDGLITGAIDARHSVERLEILLRTILLAGAFELHHHADAPTGVIINDYVDVTRAFYNAKEPGLVNGILDKLAGKLRSC